MKRVSANSRRGLSVRAIATSSDNDDLKEAGLTLLRVATGVLMIHNGFDKLADPEGFAKFVVEPYLGLPGLPATYLAAYVELICSVTFIIGFFTRPSALALCGTMGGALVFHLNKTGLEGFPFGVVEAHQYAFEAAALYAAIFLFFAMAGGGKYSLDTVIGDDSDE
eukprot:CAMPEP_0196585016 /NCGR_PEP_ID=MMETSP1081-20130531/49336_1 /TAXON_ID=36882 /ORGANISM="Pyramimonas amylifera, Strain CCMP720" /LENGTH=165 /DNA_ID=CAMNT_0041906421 /DNA_START=182 /DNA_END=679 /DNA_ORIENTATION=-